MPQDCAQGFKRQYFSDKNETWCCPGDEPPDAPKPPGDKPSADCIPLTRDFVGGKGQNRAIWRDPEKRYPDKYYRSVSWEGHRLWDPTTKLYYHENDLIAFHQDGVPLPKGQNKVCPKGTVRKGVWCCPSAGGGGAGGGGTGTNVPDWWDWSDKTQGLLGLFGDRIKYLFENPRGMSEEEKQAIANYATRGIKEGERGNIRAIEERLARQGMAGGGEEFQEVEKIRRGTREDVAGVQQAIAIDDAQKRFDQLMQTTSMSSMLMQLLMGGETTVEALNAARRGEGRMDLSLLLQYLGIISGSNDDSYNQALLNLLLSGGL
jgi:hypothetical protein